MGMEYTLRNRLAGIKAEQIYKQINTPGYIDRIREDGEAFLTTLPERLKEVDYIEESDIADIVSHFKEEIEKVSKPAELKKQAVQKAQQMYFREQRESFENLMTQLDGLYGTLEEICPELTENEEIDNAMEEIKSGYKTLLEICDDRDAIVKELVVIAERDGIEAALEQEAEYEAIRNVYPTADDYIERGMQFLDSSRALWNGMSTLTSISELDSTKTTISLLTQLTIEFASKTLGELERERFVEEAKKIYGE